MSYHTGPASKSPLALTIIQWALLVAAPLFYLLVASIIGAQDHELQPGSDMIYYILIIIAMVQPLVYVLLERFHIANYKRSQVSAMQPGQLLFNLMIIRFALIEAIYIYGLVNFFITHDFSRILIFYAIGIVWTVIYWPTAERRQRILDKIGTKA